MGGDCRKGTILGCDIGPIGGKFGSLGMVVPVLKYRHFTYDEVTLFGYCERPGFRRIGFGECRGRIADGRAPESDF
jgi:fumarylacetoacetase